MNITVVVDDYCGTSKLLGEHGLSLFIETPRGNLLFDTGRGMALYPNASTLGIRLGNLDGVVLSHGHFDHTWGLPEILRREGNIPVWASLLFDQQRFARRGKEKEIAGSLLRKDDVNFHSVGDSAEIIEGVWAITVPLSERNTDFIPVDSDLVVEEKGEFKADQMEDDLSLVVRGIHGYSIILGCAHAGSVNILERASRLFNTRDFYSVIGGMHFRSQNEEFLIRSATEFKDKFSVQYWRPCHCTGFKAAFTLGKILNDVDWAPSGSNYEV